MRAVVVCLGLMVGFSVISAKLIQAQVRDPESANLTKSSRFKSKTVLPGFRGQIIDRNDQTLARNRPLAKLIVDGNHLRDTNITSKAVLHHLAKQAPDWNSLPDDEKRKRLRRIRINNIAEMSDDQITREHMVLASDILGRELDLPPGALLEKLGKGKAHTVLLKDVREVDARRVEAVLDRHYIQGFQFERYHQRHYPLPNCAPHIIGFLNHKNEPEMGLEKSLQELLVGRDGNRELRRDVRGHFLYSQADSVQQAVHGKHVRLTLDVGIQTIVEDELLAVAEQYDPVNASIIITDPHTGDLLAAGSYPSFSLDDRKDVNAAWNASAWQRQYECGSVLKLISMSAALDAGVAHLGEEVHCGWGKIRRPHILVKDHHPYGDLSFEIALAKSSNTGAFLFGERLGAARFYEYLDAFGFGTKTNFCLPKEVRGRVSDRRNPQNFASATYGYGVAVSPMQLAMAYGVVANGGQLMKPRLVSDVITNEGKVIIHHEPKVVRRVLQPGPSRDMRLALETVVTKGTGKRAAVPGYRVAGKTGTAWKYVPKEKRYDPNRKAATFAGFMPVEKPRFVCIVAIDDPRKIPEDGKISGGLTAAPVFASVARKVIGRLGVLPGVYSTRTTTQGDRP